MVKPEKRVTRNEDNHPDPEYDNRDRGGRTIFYKQPTNRDRGNSQGSPGALDGGIFTMTRQTHE